LLVWLLFFAGITSSLAMGHTLDGIHETSLVGLKIKELGLWSNEF
jgi:hypothetical protein